MPYTDFSNNITHKLQNAAKAMVQARITANSLESLLPLANVFAGISGSSIEAKRVVCLCKNAVVAEPWEGNWMADLDIEVHCPFADIAENDFHELCGQIFAFFFQAQGTVESRLSNADIKFTAQFVVPRGTTWDVESDENGKGAEWVSRVRFQVLCSGSVIA